MLDISVANDQPDSLVEYQTNGGKGTIVSTDTTDNTILLSDAADATRDNRWIKGTVDSDGNAGNSGETGNAAGAVDFYVAGGQNRQNNVDRRHPPAVQRVRHHTRERRHPQEHRLGD